jgi:AraC-like DNA-binding protein
MQQYQPSLLLQPFIKTFRIIESDKGMVNKLLPDTALVMAFRIKGEITYTDNAEPHPIPVSVITGIRKSSRVVDYSKNTATLLVIFKEGGAAAFFKAPLHELSDTTLSLDALIPRATIQMVEEQLQEAHNDQQRIAIVENFLLSELKQLPDDGIVQQAIQLIVQAKGDIRIKNLVSALPVSRDPFEKKFRRITGTSPKQFSQIVRFRNLIETYSGKVSLTDMAYTAGYFDQAHFIKDFKAFTGQTPHDFFKLSVWW